MGLTDEQKEEYTECFKLFDKEETGKIDSSEIGSVIRALGLNPSEPEVEALVKSAAPSGGKVGPEAIFKVMEEQKIVNGTEEEIIDAFKIFDNQGNGKIPASELKAVYCNMGEAFNEAEAEQLMAVLPTDEKGYVDYAEFTKMMLSA